MKRAVLAIAMLTAGLATSSIGPASADHTPTTPDYTLVDGTPICGVEGTGAPGTLSAGEVPDVGTYNILHSQAEDDRADVTARQDLIIDAMLEGDVDIWGLQEVTNDAEHGNQAQELAAALADETGEAWSWCWSKSSPHFPGEPDVLPGGGGPMSALTAQFSKLPEGDLSGFMEGLTVVTRLDIVESGAKFRRLTPRAHEALACPPSVNPLDFIDCQFPTLFDHRQVLFAPVDADGDGVADVDMFTTHLAHGLTDHSNDVKLAQTQKALATIAEWHDPATPDFFVGDFNSGPGTYLGAFEAAAAEFTDTYGASGGAECGTSGTDGCTSSVEQFLPDGETQDGLDSRIDHVFGRTNSSGCALSVASSVIIGTNTKPGDGGTIWPSDHLGLVSHLTCA